MRVMSVSDEKLEHAHALAAEIVATHSKRYAPLFEILDIELERRRSRLATINQTASNARLSTQRAKRRKQRRNRPGKDAQSSPVRAGDTS